MFGFLHRKRNDDIDDIRSSVLGDRFDEPDFPKRTVRPDLDDPFKKLEEPGFDERQRFEPPGFASIDTRAPEKDYGRDRNYERNYDIVDRLNIIESQLVAIRSQTETINERLKNMESRLGLQRRY